MARKIFVENYEDGVLVDASSVVLSDITGTYGIRVKETGVVTIAAGTATVNESTGVYTYDIDALDTDTVYEYVFKITRSSGDIEYVEGEIEELANAGEAYATTEEAQAYFNGRLNTDAWDDASTSDKQASLIMATRLIDRLNFLGDKTSDDQTLQFPRYDDSSIPDDIKYACSEIALALLDGVDPELEFQNLLMKAQGFANVRSTYERGTVPLHVVSGIPSSIAWNYLRPYLRDANTVDLSRVS